MKRRIIMADTKRKFYNAGDAKGFTKAIFFQTVEAMANGEEVDEGLVALVGAAAAYELDGIAAKADARGTGEKKDPLQSDYAVALSAAIVPFVDSEPRTAKELIDIATGKGKLSPKGTPFAAPWVSRVLNATVGITVVKKVVDKTDAKGLKSQSEVNAYIRG
jgi:hypothetical protein